MTTLLERHRLDRSHRARLFWARLVPARLAWARLDLQALRARALRFATQAAGVTRSHWEWGRARLFVWLRWTQARTQYRLREARGRGAVLWHRLDTRVRELLRSGRTWAGPRRLPHAPIPLARVSRYPSSPPPRLDEKPAPASQLRTKGWSVSAGAGLMDSDDDESTAIHQFIAPTARVIDEAASSSR